jgi:signal transduction histidine kinase
VLQVVNITQIGTNATAAEVQKTSAHSKELVAYMDDQKEYKAHFVTLASVIKEQEKNRLTIALGATAVGVLFVGSLATIFVTRQLMKPVKEAYESQERFLQDAAHELRNPLAALTIALQQHKGNSDSNKRLFDTFSRQTRRLVQINEDLLFLERKSSSKLTKVYLTDLLLDVLEDLSLSANKKKIKLEVLQNQTIYKTIAASDYVRIIKNVVDNAIKYSPLGSTIDISQTLERGHIKITVSDAGIGIPANELAKIGNRFFRAKNVGTIDGTGLGMAIIQKILNSYGGKFSIVSTIQKGTTVTLSIPT